MAASPAPCISYGGMPIRRIGAASSDSSTKGEALHDLRAFLMVANKGQLHQSRGEALTHQALCLNLVTNAIIVWNTVYMAAVVEQLKQEGSRMVKKLMRLRARSISKALQAVHDTASGLGAPCLD
jgi:hypothetical protein